MIIELISGVFFANSVEGIKATIEQILNVQTCSKLIFCNQKFMILVIYFINKCYWQVSDIVLSHILFSILCNCPLYKILQLLSKYVNSC